MKIKRKDFNLCGINLLRADICNCLSLRENVKRIYSLHEQKSIIPAYPMKGFACER